MITDQHFHLESLEQFTSDLASAGFRQVTDSDPQRWTGEIHPAFAPLTEAKTMDIVIAPGWPFRPPALFVQGLNTNHSMRSGLVCMWHEGDPSLEWATLDGLYSRIEKRCETATSGWEDDLLDQDAWLNFSPQGCPRCYLRPGSPCNSRAGLGRILWGCEPRAVPSAHRAWARAGGKQA